MVKIYTLSDPITGEIRYIGKTKRELRTRYYDHISNYKLSNYDFKWKYENAESKNKES